MYLTYRVAAKIFVFVFSRKFREIINIVFCIIFLQFREIFAKRETGKHYNKLFKNSLPKSIENVIFLKTNKLWIL